MNPLFAIFVSFLILQQVIAKSLSWVGFDGYKSCYTGSFKQPLKDSNGKLLVEGNTYQLKLQNFGLQINKYGTVVTSKEGVIDVCYKGGTLLVLRNANDNCTTKESEYLGVGKGPDYVLKSAKYPFNVKPQYLPNFWSNSLIEVHNGETFMKPIVDYYCEKGSLNRKQGFYYKVLGKAKPSCLGCALAKDQENAVLFKIESLL